MMEKEFVNYEIALELKELGFNEPCIGFWWNNKDFTEPEFLLEYCEHVMDGNLKRPTFSQTFAFFREKYGYDVTIKKCTPSDYKFEIEQLFAEGNNHYFIDFPFKSHKEAELKCIDKLIETVKRKV